MKVSIAVIKLILRTNKVLADGCTSTYHILVMWIWYKVKPQLSSQTVGVRYLYESCYVV